MAKKRTITVALRESDDARLDELAGHNPLLTRHRAAELALHLGVEEMHADRALLDEALAEVGRGGNGHSAKGD